MVLVRCFVRLVGKQRAMPIIRPGNYGFISDVLGGSLTAMLQALSSPGTRIMATSLLNRLHWHVLFTISWWNRIWPMIVVKNDPVSHVSCIKYPCTPLTIIISIVLSNLSPSFYPRKLWVRMLHLYGHVSLGLGQILESEPMLWPG